MQIRSLVGMLNTLGLEGEAELRRKSHVEQLLSKLPIEMRAESDVRWVVVLEPFTHS